MRKNDKWSVEDGEMTTVAGLRDAALDGGDFTRRRFLARLGGGIAIAMTSTQPLAAAGRASSLGEWVSPLHGHRVTWQADLFEQPDATSIPTSGTELLSIYLAGANPGEFVSMEITPRVGPASFGSAREAEAYLELGYFAHLSYPPGVATSVWTISNIRAAGMLYYTQERRQGTCAYVEYQAPRLPNTPLIVLTFSTRLGKFDDAVTGRALSTLRINDEPAFVASQIENVLKDISGIQAASIGNVTSAITLTAG